MKQEVTEQDIKIEIARAACVVAAILLDLKEQRNKRPTESELIHRIETVLFMGRTSGSVEEMIRSRNQLLAGWLVEYLAALRPRLFLLPESVTAKNILDKTLEIEPQFAAEVAAIRQDPNRFAKNPQTEGEWIARSAYAYLQMRQRLQERADWKRSEFSD